MFFAQRECRAGTEFCSNPLSVQVDPDDILLQAAVTTAIRGKTMASAGEELGEEVTAPHPMAPAEFK